ncbi:hypothetical protein E1264_09215 [Actinomadura sp. KC216]|uniref:hypothetical protein n=1 Tax=Actinomadura sp. KC216 TaxID=2530370 RepID=UPI0010524403|nr:hypothetical protein [Actinomadura sp. KC216]TDB89140.1 hypothetical protein E1264_09215 [Actinomadura sp. KC216]
MSSTTTYRAQRALTPDELIAIREEIEAAGGPVEIVARVARAVFTALLAPLGESLDDYNRDRQLFPDQFAIPQTQWQSICDAALDRADAFGARALLALELIDVMPCSCQNPDAPVPPVERVDQRPFEHVVTVTREATDVIAAASAHCDRLAASFGIDSQEYREAVTTWQHGLSRLFAMGLGARTYVTRDGDLSLLVHCESGFLYGIVFHPVRRRCTRDGCRAVINDDGRAWTYLPDDPKCPDGDHTASYPLDGPHPGTWQFHS